MDWAGSQNLRLAMHCKCAVGTHASITLFASYYEFHITRGALRFAAGCRAHDHTFRNPALKVLITRKGAQVNGP